MRTLGASVEEKSSYKKTTDGESTVSVSYIKAIVDLKADANYEYRVGDKYLNAYTEYVSLKTVNPNETDFKGMTTSFQKPIR